MNILLDPVFWIAALAMYLLLQVEVPLRASFRFGLLNAVILVALVGWRMGLVVLGFGCLLWAGLRVACLARDRGWRRAALAGFVVLAIAMVALFVGHKANLQQPQLFQEFRDASPRVASLLLGTLVAASFSYVFLRAVDMARMVVLDRARLLDPISLVGYLAPFHMLVAGPISPYRDHLGMDQARRGDPTLAGLVRNLNLITTGLLYKLVIADSMRIYAFGLDGAVQAERWLESAFALVYVFFDFAGYSLVSLGIGRLCGVPTPRNFERPFFVTSITRFWTAWHVSLGDFVRRNIFTPLQLAVLRRTQGRWPAFVGLGSLVVSFTFVALWHHLGMKILVWGWCMGAIMVVEKIVRDRCLKLKWAQSRPARVCVRLLGPVYVFVVITTGLQLVAREVLG